MGVIAEGILRGCQGLFTPVSLGYPLSVFNKKLYSQRKELRCLNSSVLRKTFVGPFFFPHYQFSIKTLFSTPEVVKSGAKIKKRFRLVSLDSKPQKESKLTNLNFFFIRTTHGVRLNLVWED